MNKPGNNHRLIVLFVACSCLCLLMCVYVGYMLGVNRPSKTYSNLDVYKLRNGGKLFIQYGNSGRISSLVAWDGKEEKAVAEQTIDDTGTTRFIARYTATHIIHTRYDQCGNTVDSERLEREKGAMCR